MNSPKSTISGIAMIVAAASTVLTAYSAGSLTAEVITAAVGMLIGGIGLFFARDNSTSDQEAGARPEPEGEPK